MLIFLSVKFATSLLTWLAGGPYVMQSVNLFKKCHVLFCSWRRSGRTLKGDAEFVRARFFGSYDEHLDDDETGNFLGPVLLI